MAKAQHVDDDHSLSPAEYFIKYCVDEKIGRSLNVAHEGDSYDGAKNESKIIDREDNRSLSSEALRKNTSLMLSEEFRMHAKDNQWATRRERGLPWRCDIFDFLRDVYLDWIKIGMTQADLKKVDPDAYRSLRAKIDIKKESFPEDFYLPTSREAALDRCETPEERARLLAVREHERERSVRRGLVAPQS